MAGTPAGVDEVPVIRGELDGVPRVVSLVSGIGIVTVAVALAMAAHDNGFEAAVQGEDGKELGVPSTDGESRPKRGSWVLGGDGFGEEAGHVVGYVVVKPGEQDPGLFKGRGERLGQGEGEGGQGRGSGPVELRQRGMAVRAGEVVTGEAWERGPSRRTTGCRDKRGSTVPRDGRRALGPCRDSGGILNRAGG